MSSEACCKLRFKVALAPSMLPESVCGVSDVELADVMTFEKSPLGRPVVAFRFCPWCGAPWKRTGQLVENGDDE